MLKRFISKAVARVKRKAVTATVGAAGGEHPSRGVPIEYVKVLETIVSCPVMCTWAPAQAVEFTRQSIAQMKERGELRLDIRVPSDAQLKRKFRALGSKANTAAQ